MKRDYVEFQSRNQPVGYLLTFRCYGTWLHGDERGAVDRSHRRYGTPYLPASLSRETRSRALLTQPPVYLNAHQRSVVETSIRKTCTIRQWQLWACNVRTNHAHAVVSTEKNPDSVISALKANATRSMREAGCWRTELTPWAKGGSKKYLWSEEELGNAIAYVKYDQGLPLT